MTAVDDARSADGPAVGGRLRSLGSAPLWSHALAVAVVLLALVPLVGPDWAFSADEGVALAQVDRLAAGDGWVVDAPLPDLAPTVTHFELVERTETGYAPYAKHVLYPVLLVGPFAALGAAGAVLVSVLGTVLAALGAGVVARDLLGGWARSTLWLAGAGSPLLFDGYLVIAHTAAAAAAVWGFVAIERATRADRVAWGWAASGLAAWSVASLARNEAVLLGVSAGIVGVVASAGARRWIVAGIRGIPAVAAVAAFLADPRLTEAVVGARPGTIGAVAGGGGGSGVASGDSSSFLGDRIEAFVVTVLLPGYGNFDLASVAILLSLLGFLGATTVALRRPEDGDGIRVFVGLAVVAAVVRLVFGPALPIPGLFVAFPVLAAGALVVVARWGDVAPAGRRAFATSVVFGLAVLATQYASGGSGEWGGRYFAVALPLAVPVVVVALARISTEVDRSARTVAVGGVVVVSACLTVLSIATLRSSHDAAEELVREVAELQDDTGARAVVSADGYLARVAWRSAIDRQWLTVGRGADRRLAETLVADGRGPVLVVGRGSDQPSGADAVDVADTDWTAILVTG